MKPPFLFMHSVLAAAHTLCRHIDPGPKVCKGDACDPRSLKPLDIGPTHEYETARERHRSLQISAKSATPTALTDGTCAMVNFMKLCDTAATALTYTVSVHLLLVML